MGKTSKEVQERQGKVRANLERAGMGFWECKIYELSEKTATMEDAENFNVIKAIRYLLYLDCVNT